MTSPDVVVVGSGPNGLAAAATLARAGLGVQVFERSDAPGGGTRTAELTLPGYHHDICSAVHPLAVASPFFRAFGLAERLELLTPRCRSPIPFPIGRRGWRTSISRAPRTNSVRTARRTAG